MFYSILWTNIEQNYYYGGFIVLTLKSPPWSEKRSPKYFPGEGTNRHFLILKNGKLFVLLTVAFSRKLVYTIQLCISKHVNTLHRNDHNMYISFCIVKTFLCK